MSGPTSPLAFRDTILQQTYQHFENGDTAAGMLSFNQFLTPNQVYKYLQGGKERFHDTHCTNQERAQAVKAYMLESKPNFTSFLDNQPTTINLAPECIESFVRRASSYSPPNTTLTG
jgi:hypothetical protein